MKFMSSSSNSGYLVCISFNLQFLFIPKELNCTFLGLFQKFMLTINFERNKYKMLCMNFISYMFTIQSYIPIYFVYAERVFFKIKKSYKYLQIILF